MSASSAESEHEFVGRSDEEIVTDPEVLEAAAELAAADSAVEESPDEGEDVEGRPGREAARYRKRLRDTEVDRNRLRAQLEAMQRSEAERLASASLRVPGGLWAAGVQLADLVDDQGVVDAMKVREAASAAAEAIGLERQGPRAPRPDYSQGRGGSQGTPDAFRAAFAPPRN